MQTKPSIVDQTNDARDLQQLEEIALWLDRRFIDPLLGFFFPGAGNTLGAVLGLYGVFVAVRMGVHPIVIARMLLNLAIDSLVGTIPFLGVIFDLLYRAHVRNLELVKQRAPSGEARASDWIIVLGAAFLFLFALVLPVIVVGFLIFLLMKG